MRHDTFRRGTEVHCKKCGKLGEVNGMGPQVNSSDPWYKRLKTWATTFVLKLSPFSRFSKDASDQHDEDYLAGETLFDRYSADYKWKKTLILKNQHTRFRIIKRRRSFLINKGFNLLRTRGKDSFNYEGCDGNISQQNTTS